MGLIVPLVVGYLVELKSLGDYFAVSVCTFFGWCIAEFVANILSGKRLENRTPRGVIREFRGEHSPDDVNPPRPSSPTA